MIHHSIMLFSLSHMSRCFGWVFFTCLLTIHSPEAQTRYSCIACRSLLRGRNCVVCAKSQSVPLLSETTVRGREETRGVREALLCQHPAFPPHRFMKEKKSSGYLYWSEPIPRSFLSIQSSPYSDTKSRTQMLLLCVISASVCVFFVVFCGNSRR